MATYTPVRASHRTLSGSTVDTVILQGAWPSVEIVNRDTTGFWVNYGAAVADLPDPTVAGDDTVYVPAGSVVTLEATNRKGFTVKIAGSGEDYSVQGVDQ